MRFKRAIVFVLCIVLALPLAACGKSGTKKKPGSSGGGEGGEGGGEGTEYTITFNLGEGEGHVSQPIDKKVKHGQTIDFLVTPKDFDEYAFVGWFENNEQFTMETVVTRDWHLTAKWANAAEMNAEAKAYEDKISDWDVAGHLYIHYKRYDHKASEQTTAGTPTNSGAPNYSTAISSDVYGDWGLWLWPKNEDGRLFNPAWIDASGAVYDILIDNLYTDAGWDGKAQRPMDPASKINYNTADKNSASIGMQLFQVSTRQLAGFWANDGGNNYLTLNSIVRTKGSYHWFVSQGRVGSGKKVFGGQTLKNPYDGDDGTKHATRITEGDGIINSSKTSSYDIYSNKVTGYEEAGVGYQIFIASFADGIKDDENTELGKGMGDLRGVINKIDENYFTKLNVDVLWLTPFQTSTNYHGYDIKDYFSVDPRFGTLADYRELVYKAHKKGIKVIMDFVLNHTAQSNPWFVKSQNLETEEKDGKTIDYRQFYTWITKAQYDKLGAQEQKQWYKDSYGYYFYSSFSSDQPELNYDYQPVRDAILDVCNYWMEFGLDGFRLDAVKHIYMKNEVVGAGKTASTGNIDNGEGCVEDGVYSYDLKRNLNFYREFNARLKANYPNAFVVGENLDGNPRNVTNYYQGIDSQFNFNLYYDATRSFAASQQTEGGFGCGDANTAINKYFEAYYGNEYNKQETGEHVVVKGYSQVNPNFIDGLYTSNHDLPRARDRVNITTNANRNVDNYRKITSAADITRTDNVLRMYYAYVMTIPGLNWIYYGDEIGMSGVMQTTIDSPTGSTDTVNDSEPHEDRIYRQPMKWHDTGNASFDIGYGTLKCELTGPNTALIDSVDKQMSDDNPNSLWHWVQKLTEVRHNNPVLINGKIAKTNETMSGSTLFYTVSNGSQSIKVYINVGDYEFTVPNGEVLASYNMNGRKLTKYGIAIVK